MEEFNKFLKEKYMDDDENWHKMPYWYGNPELGYECWGKVVVNSSYSNTSHYVYIFGKENLINEPYHITNFRFVVVSSHSGMFKPDSNVKELMNYIEFRGELGLLTHGRSLTEKEEQQFYSQINDEQRV